MLRESLYKIAAKIIKSRRVLSFFLIATCRLRKSSIRIGDGISGISEIRSRIYEIRSVAAQILHVTAAIRDVTAAILFAISATEVIPRQRKDRISLILNSSPRVLNVHSPERKLLWLESN